MRVKLFAYSLKNKLFFSAASNLPHNDNKTDTSEGQILFM